VVRDTEIQKRASKVGDIFRAQFDFEYERHEQLVNALCISPDAVGTGYDQASERDGRLKKGNSSSGFSPRVSAMMQQMLSQNPEVFQAMRPEADGMEFAEVEVHAVKYNGVDPKAGTSPHKYSIYSGFGDCSRKSGIRMDPHSFIAFGQTGHNGRRFSKSSPL